MITFWGRKYDGMISFNLSRCNQYHRSKVCLLKINGKYTCDILRKGNEIEIYIRGRKKHLDGIFEYKNKRYDGIIRFKISESEPNNDNYSYGYVYDLRSGYRYVCAIVGGGPSYHICFMEVKDAEVITDRWPFSYLQSFLRRKRIKSQQRRDRY